MPFFPLPPRSPPRRSWSFGSCCSGGGGGGSLPIDGDETETTDDNASVFLRGQRPSGRKARKQQQQQQQQQRQQQQQQRPFSSVCRKASASVSGKDEGGHTHRKLPPLPHHPPPHPPRPPRPPRCRRSWWAVLGKEQQQRRRHVAGAARKDGKRPPSYILPQSQQQQNLASRSFSTDSLPSDDDGDADDDNNNNNNNNNIVGPPVDTAAADAVVVTGDNGCCFARESDRPVHATTTTTTSSSPFLATITTTTTTTASARARARARADRSEQRRNTITPFMIVLEGCYASPGLLEYDTEDDGEGDFDKDEIRAVTNDHDHDQDAIQWNGSGNDFPHRHHHSHRHSGNDPSQRRSVDHDNDASDDVVGTVMSLSLECPLTPEQLEYQLESAIPERLSWMASTANTERSKAISKKILQLRRRLKLYENNDPCSDLLSTCSFASVAGNNNNNNNNNNNSRSGSSSSTSKCIILILQPTKKAYEFVPVDYQPDSSTVRDLLSQIPECASCLADYSLRFQRYQGLAAMDNVDGKVKLMGADARSSRQGSKGRATIERPDRPFDEDDDDTTSGETRRNAATVATSQTVVPRRYCLDYHVEQEAPLVAVPENFSVLHIMALARMLMKDPNVQRSFQELQELLLSGLEF